MPNPYPTALRERAVRAYEAGTETYAEVSARFSIHLNTVVRWVQRARDRGTVLPAPRGGGGARPSVEHLAGLAADWVRLQKKRRRPAEQDRAPVQAERHAFRQWIAGVDPRRLVFVDESGANLAMGRS